MQPSGGEQPETAAIMDWSRRVGFVASASMHEVPECLQLLVAVSGG